MQSSNAYYNNLCAHTHTIRSRSDISEVIGGESELHLVVPSYVTIILNDVVKLCQIL